MKYESWNIAVEGQKTGEAVLHGYLLDAISVAPEKKRPAVIVCAGGGYARRSDREAEPVILQFLSMGYHGFLLDYSVEPNRFPTSVRELALAVSMVREHAEEWHVDPEKIFVCGFSAAGHLCCSLGEFWNQEFVYGAIGKTPEAIRPSGLILCYPVITAGGAAHRGSFDCLVGEQATKEELDQVSLELHVHKDMPKTFIWHTYEDQAVPVENSLYLATALRKAGVNFELHIFPRGLHGSALANEETSGIRQELVIPAAQKWIELVHTWIEEF